MHLYVRLTNKNDFVIKDRHHGTLYMFEPGKAVDLPYEAAEHFLGLTSPEGINDTEAVFLYVSRRWGWNREVHTKEGQDRKWFNKLDMEIISYEMVPVRHSSNLAAPRSQEPKKILKKKGARRGRKPMMRHIKDDATMPQSPEMSEQDSLEAA